LGRQGFLRLHNSVSNGKLLTSRVLCCLYIHSTTAASRTSSNATRRFAYSGEIDIDVFREILQKANEFVPSRRAPFSSTTR
jgi:hypothetical protein